MEESDRNDCQLVHIQRGVSVKEKKGSQEETINQILSNRGYDMAAEEMLNWILSNRGLRKLYEVLSPVPFFTSDHFRYLQYALFLIPIMF